MPTNEIFINHMKNMDIRKSDMIILYDKVNVFSAPRAFFTFKWFGHNNVRVLNGGGVANRKQARSKYGAKRPKDAKK